VSILPTPDPHVLAVLVSNVTQTMLGMSFAARDLSEMVRESHMTPSWRTAMLPIFGARPLTIALSSDQVSCAALGAAMFSCPIAEVDNSMMDDSISELLNMTAGQIKGALALDQALGLPKIVTNAQLEQIAHTEWKSVALKAGPVELVVWLIERVF